MRILKRKAFTLIEVLVAIAIIMVVAAILMTTFRAAIHAAKVNVCTSHLSQVGRAAELYAADFDEYIPPYYITSGFALKDGTDIPALPELYKIALTKYGLADEQFFCPLDKDAHKRVTKSMANIDHTQLSYIYSPAVYKFKESGGSIIKLPLARVERPSESVYLMDDGWTGGSDFENTAHGDWRNNLYFDGHIKERPTHSPACYYPGQQKGRPD